MTDRAGSTVTRDCPICGGIGFLDDFEMTPCPAGCDPCWKCHGTKVIVNDFCSASPFDADSCCGGYCPVEKVPCDAC